MKIKGFLCFVFVFGVFMLGVTNRAFAIPPSCQEDMNSHAKKRMRIISTINGFAKNHPTPQKACGVLGELVSAEAAMLQWMDNNKEWCQLPEPFVEDFKKATYQGIKAKKQACSAAARSKNQGGVPPQGINRGSNIPLPKGAL